MCTVISYCCKNINRRLTINMKRKVATELFCKHLCHKLLFLSLKMFSTVTQYCLLLLLVFITAFPANGLVGSSNVRTIRKYEGHDCEAWFSFMKCTDEGTVLSIGHCMTYSQGEGTFAIQCPYFQLEGHDIAERGYIRLPSNISDLNEYMCGSMYRRGWLCKDCIDGFGPSITSTGYKCVNCIGVWYGIPLYLLQEFVPITIFFFFILIFRIHLASAPMTCFIMYSHLRTIEALLDPQPPMSDILNKPFSKVISVFYGVWNLDFIQYVLPAFCVSNKIQLMHILLLNYISSIYPIVLIFLTWLCIELHDRNFRLLVWLWRPFHSCFTKLRRNWDTKRDMVDVLASFFLVSFSKMAYQSILFLQCPHLTRLDEEGRVSTWRAMAYDPSIICKATNMKFLLIAIAASVSIIVFNALPALLLVLYPIKRFRALLSKFRLDCLALITFVEKFHGCYRDGLDGGRDMRSFSGLYFVLRFTTFFFRINKHIVVNAAWTYLVFTFLACTLLMALARPYKRMYMNIIDTLLLADLTLLCHLFTRRNSSDEVWQVMTVTSGPVILFGGFALYKVCVQLKTKQRLTNIWQLFRHQFYIARINSELGENCTQNRPLLSPISVRTDFKSCRYTT